MSGILSGPKRTLSHQIADKAKNQIIDLFSDQGWIADPVITDYGDDIHSQLTRGEVLLPVRFYAQIKGTNDIKTLEHGDYYKISKIKKTSISHWLNSDEISILILWDTKKKFGVYEFPEDVFSKEDLDKKQRTFSVSFRKTQIINQKTINQFKNWLISIYCHKKLMNLLALESFIQKNKRRIDAYGLNPKLLKNDMTDVSIFYLTSIGALEVKSNKIRHSKKFYEEFLKELKPIIDKIRKPFVLRKVNKATAEALTIALINLAQKKTNHGISLPLIEGSMMIFEALLTEARNAVKKTLEGEK